MTLYSLFVIVACAFAALHWWVLPKLELRARIDRSRAAFGTTFEEEFARVAEAIQSGTAAELPPTEAMKTIDEMIQRVLRELETIETTAPTPKQKELEEILTVLPQRRLALDVERRLQRRIDPDQVPAPLRETLRERLALILVSRHRIVTGRGL